MMTLSIVFVLLCFLAATFGPVAASHPKRNQLATTATDSAYTPSLQIAQAEANALCAFRCGITNWPGTLVVVTPWGCDCNTVPATATTNPCSTDNVALKTWTGIECTGDSILRINLNNKNFIGTISNQFSGLSELIYLDIGINKLAGTVPSQFTSFSKLETLYFDRNKLTGVLGPIYCLPSVTLNNLYQGTNSFSCIDTCFDIKNPRCEEEEPYWTCSTGPCVNPTENPTLEPSEKPTFEPSFEPSEKPTFEPSFEPSENPTFVPSAKPTNAPVATVGSDSDSSGKDSGSDGSGSGKDSGSDGSGSGKDSGSDSNVDGNSDSSGADGSGSGKDSGSDSNVDGNTDSSGGDKPVKTTKPTTKPTARPSKSVETRKPTSKARKSDSNANLSSGSSSNSAVNERMLMIILIVSVLVFILAAFGCYKYRRNGELKRKEALVIGSLDVV